MLAQPATFSLIIYKKREKKISKFISDPIALDCTAHKLEIVTRHEWLAQPPKKPLEKLKNPVPKAIIAHTATANCTTKVS